VRLFYFKRILIVLFVVLFIPFVSGQVPVAKNPGDLNGDDKVDILDIFFVVSDFGKTVGFKPLSDLNGDGVINVFDLVKVARHWGKIYGLDIKVPIIISGVPSGLLLSGTTKVVFGVSTNEISYCKYSSVSGTSFSSMDDFKHTNSTMHAVQLVGLVDGTNYSYFVLCKDEQDNLMVSEYVVSFGVGGVFVGSLVNECDGFDSDWIWCDDFEIDRLSSYFEYGDDGGDFIRMSNVGVNSSVGMRVLFQVGESSAGDLKLAFGRTPQAYFSAVDLGVVDYRDVYWRMYLRHESGWVGGGGNKLSRATIFASSSSWAQAAFGHVWSGGVGDEFLALDPASGTDLVGNLLTTKYNDFANMNWLGKKLSVSTLFSGSDVGQWYCVEVRMKLNDAGLSNGVFTLWVDGVLEAENTGMNWVGSFSDYGINTIIFENYWNAGSVATQERYFDNIVVSTKKIGCGDLPSSPPDITPPVISNPQPSGTLSSGTTSVTLSVDTDEDATCKYDTSNVAYSSMVSDFTTTGGTTHSRIVSGLSDGSSYTYYARCQDTSNNTNKVSKEIIFSVATSGADITPPVISNPQPSGILSSGTTSVTLSVDTDEDATCKYDTSNVAYSSMVSDFTITGGTTHSRIVSGLSDGSSYTYYARCQDTSNNTNMVSTDIIFSVASGGASSYYISNHSGSGSGTIGDPYGMADLGSKGAATCSQGSAAFDLQPGDTLYFRGGTYDIETCTGVNVWNKPYLRPLNSGTISNPIVVRSYPGEDVIITSSAGGSPLFGARFQNNIVFMGFTTLQKDSAFYAVNSNNIEFAYNDATGITTTTGDNVEIFRIQNTNGMHIHHNKISKMIGPGDNSAGIKFYNNENAIIEDNYIFDNTVGIFDKEEGFNNTYRRNYFADNGKDFKGPGQGLPASFRIYENVFKTGKIGLNSLNDDTEFHDNILLNSNSMFGAWQTAISNQKAWNNIVLTGGSSITAFESSRNFPPISTALTYMDFNFYSATPTYSVGEYVGAHTIYTLSQMQVLGFELNTEVFSIASDIFSDTITYTLKSQYLTAGRYNDVIGPDNIAQIRNISRYGPGALT